MVSPHQWKAREDLEQKNPPALWENGLRSPWKGPLQPSLELNDKGCQVCGGYEVTILGAVVEGSQEKNTCHHLPPSGAVN